MKNDGSGQKVWFFTCSREDTGDNTDDMTGENTGADVVVDSNVELCFEVKVTEVKDAETSEPEKLLLFNEVGSGNGKRMGQSMLDDLNPKTTCATVEPYDVLKIEFNHNDGVSSPRKFDACKMKIEAYRGGRHMIAIIFMKFGSHYKNNCNHM